jgi:ATP-dependent protease ClpP protease subunit
MNLYESLSEYGPALRFPNVDFVKRRILLNAPIDESIVESVMLPLLDMSSDGTRSPIELVICTDGGATEDGMVICDMIDQIECPLTITCMTKAYSMGMYILMAGFGNPYVHKRCYSHTLGLIHAGDFECTAPLPTVMDLSMFFCIQNETVIRDYVLSHSKIKEAEYAGKWRHEWYMTADDMLEYGIVDEIIGY